MILAIHLPKMGPLQRGKREKEPRKTIIAGAGLMV